MNSNELAIITSLQDQGYAVTVFSPEELGDTNPQDVQNCMCYRGWDEIERLRPFNTEAKGEQWTR